MFIYGKEIQSIQIAFFSGTGGTARAAKAFADSFAQKGLQVLLSEMHAGKQEQPGSGDLLLLLYPVYAFNAPPPVLDWIAAHKWTNKTPAAVVSVSGGGEMSPNTACRVKVKRALVKAGCDVVYEHMLVMPSNCMEALPDEVAMRVLRILPQKVERMAQELLAGVRRSTKPLALDRVVTKAAAFERFGAKLAGKRFYALNTCNACGLCARNCPRGNIAMVELKPVFGKKCVLCLRCVYACKQRAIKSKYSLVNQAIFKEGFDLNVLEKCMVGKEPSREPLPAGFAWAGVRDYLGDELQEN